MLANCLKCCTKQIGSTACDLNQWIFKSGYAGPQRQYADNRNKVNCGKDVPQEAGRTVEPWPKNNQPPQAWRCRCPQEPMPYNNDPYRIRVPEIAVSPLPPSNAKPQLDCARKGTCAPPAPPPPPCPPPKIKPFPWIYVFATTAFLAALGVIFKYWVYNDKLKKAASFNVVWQPRQKKRRPLHDVDLPDCVQYLIIGAGAAAWAAYNAIMENDAKAKIFIVTKEDINIPYEKTQMSKHMWWNKLPPDMKTLPYYEDKYKTMYLTTCDHFMDIKKFDRMTTGPAASLASGWCVVRVDPENHIAYIKTILGEKPIYYERCLIAVGSNPVQLNIFKIAPKAVREKAINISTIRDLEIAFRRVREARHVTIIGADTMGCELAWYLARMKDKIEVDEEKPPLEIALMYKDAGVLGDVLPQYLGEWAAEKIKCEGLRLMPKTTPHDAFLSEDGRLQLTLNDGSSFVTDCALVCAGTTPNTDIAESSFLETDDINGGFLVNTELEARKHLYAAGDAASFYSQLKRTRQRFNFLSPAIEQGALAGHNMTGYWDPCNVEQAYWLKLGEGIQMEVVGDVGACMPTIALFKPCRPEDLPQQEVEEQANLPCYKDAAEYKERYKRGLLCYIRDETIVGFVFWNMPPIEDRKGVATEILRSRPHYKDINLVADLLGFKETECSYVKEKSVEDEGPCIRAYREF